MAVPFRFCAMAIALIAGFGGFEVASAQAPPFSQLYDEGLASLEAKNFRMAEADFSDFLKDSPNNIVARMMLGILQVARQDYPDAKANFERAAAINHRVPDPLGRLGWVDAKMGDMAGAQRARTALEKMNQTCRLTHCLSAAAISSGLLMIDSELTTSEGGGHFYGAGIDAIQARDWDSAETNLLEVLKENPKNPGANFLFGVVRIAQHNYPEARSYLELAQKLAPRLPDPIGRLGWVDGQLGDLAAARREHAKLEQMSRDCRKTCFEAVAIAEGLWMVDSVLNPS